MTDTQARARVWPLCLAALVLCALTGRLVGLLAPLARASAPALNVVAAVLAAAPVGASVALAVLLIVAVLRVVGPAQTATASPRGSTTVPPAWRSWSSQGPWIVALVWYHGGSNGPHNVVLSGITIEGKSVSGIARTM